MAEYRTIKMSFWLDPFIETIPAQVKLLYFFLITSPYTDNLGVLEVSRKRISYDTGLSEEAVEDGIRELIKAGKLMELDGLLWLVNFIKNQTSTSPLMVKALKNMVETLSSEGLKKAIYTRYQTLFPNSQTGEYPINTLSIPYRYPIDTPPIPIGEVEVELEVEVEVESELRSKTNLTSLNAEENPLGVSPSLPDDAKKPNLPPPDPPSKKGPVVPYGKIMALWNEILTPAGRPAIRGMTDLRKDKLRRLWIDRGEVGDFRDIDVWRKFFEYIVKQCPFVMQGGWFGFDWILSPSNFQKLIEGNYEERRGGEWNRKR